MSHLSVQWNTVSETLVMCNRFTKFVKLSHSPKLSFSVLTKAAVFSCELEQEKRLQL